MNKSFPQHFYRLSNSKIDSMIYFYNRIFSKLNLTIANRFNQRFLTQLSENSNHGEIILTQRCIQHLKRMKHEKKLPNLKLKLEIIGGGCSGFTYDFSITENEPKDSEIVLEQDGQHILVDGSSLEFLRGSTVDYGENLIKETFEVIKNPQSSSKCGCGSSFSPKDKF